MTKLHMPFYHGFGERSDMTNLGRNLHLDTCCALDMIRFAIALEKAVEAGRLHPRKAELYYSQAGALLAQVTSDMALQDPGWQAERDGQTDPVGQLRTAFEQFTRCRPENAADEAAIGREIMRVAPRMLAAIPPTYKRERTE